jgi:hypothetical protein
VTSAAASGAVVGVPIVEQSFAGIPESTVALGGKYDLDISPGAIYEIPLAITVLSGVGAVAKGQTVWINRTTGALTITAWAAAAPGGAGTVAPFGRVVAVNNDSFDLNAGNLQGAAVEPQPAFIWVGTLPQSP